MFRKALLFLSLTAIIPAVLPAYAGAAAPKARRGQVVIQLPEQADDPTPILRSAGMSVLNSSKNGRILATSNDQTLTARSSSDVVEVDDSFTKLCDDARKQLGDKIVCVPNYIFHTSAVPNDPYLSAQWGLDTIQAQSAWNITTGKASVKVGIVDTGVAYDHEDLAANIAKNTAETASNGRDDDGNGLVDDYYGWNFYNNNADPYDTVGHGTHVAGIIGARGNNSVGIAGINWTVGILPVRVLGADGGDLYTVCDGVEYAADRGASVINLSLGCGGDDCSGCPGAEQIMDPSLQRATAKGALLVIAAGNETCNNDTTPTYPANSAVANKIVVAATDNTDSLAYFSNYGPSSVHLGAPGFDIPSTYPQNLSGGDSPYLYMSGTSMAAPHVTGVAALVKAVNPSLTGAQIKNIILSTVDPLPSLSGLVSSGGRLNAYKAVLAAQNTTPSPTPQTGDPTIKLTTYQKGSTSSLRATVYGTVRNRSGAVANWTVRGVCSGGGVKYAANSTTSSAGKFTFLVTRSKKAALTCYVKDWQGIKSNTVSVKKYKAK